MSNLYVVSNVDGREESDMYSYNDKSYNSWRYGDEASLYSIAEDSREDRASEVPSMAATDKDPATAAAADHMGLEETTVEVCWAGDERESPHDDSVHYGYHERPRRKFIISTCVILIAVLAIILGVTLSNRDDGTARSSIGEGVSAGEKQIGGEKVEEETTDEVPQTTSAPDVVEDNKPTLAPPVETPQPSSSPTHSPGYVLAHSFVTMALGSCPGAVHFDEPDSMEKEIFEKLVGELLDRMSIDSGGFINFPLEVGIDYLKEKYALEMLYQSTNGNSWFSNDNWMADTDPCQGWHGITSCRERKEGSCGVEQIDLATNNLSGFISEDFCCMPCLQFISLAGNDLGGDIPSCMANMQAEINLRNNNNLSGQPSSLEERTTSP